MAEKLLDEKKLTNDVHNYTYIGVHNRGAYVI